MRRHGADTTRAALLAAVDAAVAAAGPSTAVHPARWLTAVPPGFHLTG